MTWEELKAIGREYGYELFFSFKESEAIRNPYKNIIFYSNGNVEHNNEVIGKYINYDAMLVMIKLTNE